FLIDDPLLCGNLRDTLKHVPDMPRALSRLALDRGGPRDLWSIRQGLDAAGGVAAMLGKAMLPEELSQAPSRRKQPS
ncbi:hypothetical protein ACC687_42935, partial [Rhizobium ruizarguesonis]